MPRHSNDAIMKLIEGSEVLTAAWRKLTMTMIGDMHAEFYAEMGVPVPTLPMCDPLAFQTDSSAQFACKASVQEYTQGPASVIGPAYEDNWSEVALQATNLVGTIATRIIGSGDIQTGVTAGGNSITVTPKDGKKASRTSSSPPMSTSRRARRPTGAQARISTPQPMSPRSGLRRRRRCLW